MRGCRRRAVGRCLLHRSPRGALARDLSQVAWREGRLGPAGLGLCRETGQWSMWLQGRVWAWGGREGFRSCCLLSYCPVRVLNSGRTRPSALEVSGLPGRVAPVGLSGKLTRKLIRASLAYLTCSRLQSSHFLRPVP